ncbi:hypothetical protein H2202_003451 [Exophiala xenobiotica]|nr:hypothetical protein H2202_003451 [Exophiala xenobiotica]
MVEILGVVAGGAGLASLAVQLLECIHKLHDLHANIRDAPVEIHEILEEVDLLGDVLTSYLDVSGGATRTCRVPTVVQKQALGRCSKVLEILRNIAQELETTMQASRTRRWINWAKVEAAFKRKQLARIQTALDRAKSTLTLAILIDRSSHHCVPGDAITLEELEVKVPSEDVKAVTVTPDAVVARPRAARSSSSVAMYNLGIAMVMIKSKVVPQQSEADNNGHADNREVFISLGSWLFNRAVALISHSSRNRIEMTLRIDHLVRRDAEIFDLCAAGDALGVRKLIADGKASASDVTYEGITPLMFHLLWLIIFRTALNVALIVSEKGPSTIDTFRVLVEHGGSSIDFGWSPPSANDPNFTGGLDYLIPDFNSPSAPEAFLWLIAPERINLLGQDLDLYYMSMFMTECFFGSSSFLGFSAHTIAALFQKVTDLSTLARMHDENQVSVLHSLLAWLPYLESDNQRIILQLLGQLVHVGAVEIADSMQHYTPLIWAAWLSIDNYVITYSLWRPEHASEILASGLNLWLETLGNAGVDIRHYISRQRELGAAEPFDCHAEPDYIDVFPEHFLDQTWYVELTFWENPDATEANNPRDFGIGVKYYPVQRKFPLPGAWSDEPEQNKRSDQDDVQLRVEELGTEECDDQDGDDQDDGFQDGEGSDGAAEDENCDEAADSD